MRENSSSKNYVNSLLLALKTNFCVVVHSISSNIMKIVVAAFIKKVVAKNWNSSMHENSSSIIHVNRNSSNIMKIVAAFIKKILVAKSWNSSIHENSSSSIYSNSSNIMKIVVVSFIKTVLAAFMRTAAYSTPIFMNSAS